MRPAATATSRPQGADVTAQRKPRTDASYVRASEARAIEAGARRTPRGILPPDAARALDSLHKRGYADSLTGCIARALVEAARMR